MVFNYITYADGGNHPIQHKADAADNGGRKGTDKFRELRQETEYDCITGR